MLSRVGARLATELSAEADGRNWDNGTLLISRPLAIKAMASK